MLLHHNRIRVERDSILSCIPLVLVLLELLFVDLQFNGVSHVKKTIVKVPLYKVLVSPERLQDTILVWSIPDALFLGHLEVIILNGCHKNGEDLQSTSPHVEREVYEHLLFLFA